MHSLSKPANIRDFKCLTERKVITKMKYITLIVKILYRFCIIEIEI